MRLASRPHRLLRVRFQSTHPRGVRQRCEITAGDTGEFQSTHPRGVRPPIPRTPRAGRYFNPRTHVGCDGDEGIRTQGGGISIHAPTWGATQKIYLNLCSSNISIHAPTWGATSSHYIKPQVSRISIHAPTWGATGVLCGTGLSVKISIHAPTWGATGARG